METNDQDERRMYLECISGHDSRTAALKALESTVCKMRGNKRIGRKGLGVENAWSKVSAVE